MSLLRDRLRSLFDPLVVKALPGTMLSTNLGILAGNEKCIAANKKKKYIKRPTLNADSVMLYTMVTVNIVNRSDPYSKSFVTDLNAVRNEEIMTPSNKIIPIIPKSR